MNKLALAIAAFSICSCAVAQTNLTTPVSILPKADHSAAGQMKWYDAVKGHEVTVTVSATTNGLTITGDGTTLATLYGLTSGKTTWGLGASSGAGQLYLSSGTGLGGWDGKGALVYASAAADLNGEIRALGYYAQNPGTVGSDYNTTVLGGNVLIDYQSTANIAISGSSSLGGTMQTYGSTGTLINTINHNGFTSTSLASAGNRCVYANSSGTLAIESADCATPVTVYWGLSFGNIFPTSSYNVVPNGGTLGTSGFRWTAYLGATDVSGSVTATGTVTGGTISDGVGFSASAGAASATSLSAVSVVSAPRIDATAGRLQLNGTDITDSSFDVKNIAQVTPAITNTYDLGTAALEWQHVNAQQYVVGGTAGVNCSGTPSASFAVIWGIVTHC